MARIYRYPINEYFFDSINQESCYYIGMLFADGCNVINRNSVILNLQETDKELLEHLNMFIQPTKPLNFRKITKTNHKNQYAITIHSKHISDTLSKLGCVAKKSLVLEFPKWLSAKDDNVRHFIRGYMDGDGCISISRNKQIKIAIVSTKSFCETLSTIIYDNLKITSYIGLSNPTGDTIGSNITSTLRITGNLNCIKFLDWIYKDASIRMARKYDRYIRYKIEYLDRIDHKNKDRLDIIDEIRSYYKNHSVIDTIEKFKVSSNTILKYASDEKRMDKILKIKKVREYYDSHSLDETAKRFSISHPTIIKYSKIICQ